MHYFFSLNLFSILLFKAAEATKAFCIHCISPCMLHNLTIVNSHYMKQTPLGSRIQYVPAVQTERVLLLSLSSAIISLVLCVGQNCASLNVSRLHQFVCTLFGEVRKTFLHVEKAHIIMLLFHKYLFMTATLLIVLLRDVIVSCKILLNKMQIPALLVGSVQPITENNFLVDLQWYLSAQTPSVLTFSCSDTSAPATHTIHRRGV